MLKIYNIREYMDNSVSTWDQEWQDGNMPRNILRYFFGNLSHSTNPYIYFIDENIKMIAPYRVHRG